MKGTLKKIDDNWMVEYADKDFTGMPCVGNTLPLHELNDFNGKEETILQEGRLVDFEIIPVCNDCGRDYCDNLGCKGIEGENFAKIIEPPITWEEIFEQMDQFHTEADVQEWLVKNFNPPTKKIKQLSDNDDEFCKCNDDVEVDIVSLEPPIARCCTCNKIIDNKD